MDHLAAEIGSPPSVERAQALVQRLPVTIRISGPALNWDSHPQLAEMPPRWRDNWTEDDWRRHEPRILERSTPDGHRIQFGLNMQIWHERPRLVGWITLAVLLTLTAVAYARVRRMLRPLDQITNMGWEPPGDKPLDIRRREFGEKLAQELKIAPPTDCSRCHR